jgi:hypothetical protein
VDTLNTITNARNNLFASVADGTLTQTLANAGVGTVIKVISEFTTTYASPPPPLSSPPLLSPPNHQSLRRARLLDDMMIPLVSASVVVVIAGFAVLIVCSTPCGSTMRRYFHRPKKTRLLFKRNKVLPANQPIVV